MQPNRNFGWKGRLITRLAVIGLIALGVYVTLQKLHEEEAKTQWTMRRTTDWTPQRVSLYSERGGPPRQLDAKHAGFVVVPPIGNLGRRDAKITAFNDSVSKHLYVGPESNFYIATKSSIIGVELAHGSIMWHESYDRSLNLGGGVKRAMARFERRVDGPKWNKDRRSEVRPRIPLQSFLGDDFTAASPGSGEQGEPKLENVRVTDGTLQLDMKNQTGELAGIVWIDLNTRKVTRAVLNGKQVFPDPAQEPRK